MSTVRLAESDEEIASCFAVIRQLRTHLDEPAFLPIVRRQQTTGYHLAYLEHEGAVMAVAGFRYWENLVSGRTMYVDDLVTDAASRSRGHGRALLEWLMARARENGCRHLDLDSGVQRFDAHRFYLTNRMFISAHHFKIAL